MRTACSVTWRDRRLPQGAQQTTSVQKTRQKGWLDWNPLTFNHRLDELATMGGTMPQGCSRSSRDCGKTCLSPLCPDDAVWSMACTIYSEHISMFGVWLQGRNGSTLGPRATIVVGAPHSVLGRGGWRGGPPGSALLPIWPVRPCLATILNPGWGINTEIGVKRSKVPQIRSYQWRNDSLRIDLSKTLRNGNVTLYLKTLKSAQYVYIGGMRHGITENGFLVSEWISWTMTSTWARFWWVILGALAVDTKTCHPPAPLLLMVMLWVVSLSGGFTPCRHLRPSPGRERIQSYNLFSRWWWLLNEWN